MSETKFQWYVLRAIGGKENRVKEYIDALINNPADKLGQYVSQVLIPTEKAVVMRSGKRVTKDRNTLPGYVLVECNLVDDCYPRLRNVPNVLGFLGERANAKPTPIRPSDINRFLGTIDEGQDTVDTNFVPYEVADVVKVIEGPFKGFDGTVDEVMPDKKRIKVMVVIFGRKTPLELDYAQVEKQNA
ncbi:MAG: transcription termination/antitermination factor NusG [Paludibacteraceae bacterium]|jgi:transcriptional antiterminator NusG|nr:transcription termination/antitermination factor NusG [Paludibacteraceae bacterium]